MIDKPESLTEAHKEIYRLVDLLHGQQQRLARAKRMKELLERVPVDLAQRVDPALIEAMARREGDKAAREEASRQQRDLPRFLEKLARRAEARHGKVAGDQGSVDR